TANTSTTRGVSGSGCSRRHRNNGAGCETTPLADRASEAQSPAETHHARIEHLRHVAECRPRGVGRRTRRRRVEHVEYVDVHAHGTNATDPELLADPQIDARPRRRAARTGSL